MPKKVAIAIGAHPDDIEFYMAGTLLMLKRVGWEIHYMNVANGNCGSVEYDSATAKSIRASEGKQAAKILGAHFHPSLVNDVEILYEMDTLRRLAAVIREVKPNVVLTHPPQDYMEDHTETCRLVVTAAFARGMPNFKSIPNRDVADYETTLYHSMPHGFCDQLRRKVIPGAFVNTTSVHKTKRDSLAAHKSQQGWLETSQGMNSYLLTQEDMSRDIGRMSKKFKHAEGWRRHLHFGFCAKDADPMRDVLGKNFMLNKTYERNLLKGF